MLSWFGRILAQAFARRIALVVVALILGGIFGIGRAEAACNQTSGRAWSCTTQAEAATKIAQVGSVANCQAVYGGNWEIDSFRKRDLAPGQLTIYGECFGAYNGNPKVWNTTWEAHYTTTGGCTGSTSWDPVKVECASACPTGWDIDPYNPGQCLDAQKCQARNADINTEVMRVGGDVCAPVGGCAFEASTSDISNTMLNGGGSMVRARYSYTGRPASACSAAPQGTPQEQDENKPSDTKQQCREISGQTVCVRPDGQHCYSINGKPNLSQCWQPGETGQKTQEDTAQNRNAGPSEIPPNLQLPNGDTLQKIGESVTTTTTKTTNNVTTVTTTTTTNYKTQNGTNAGTKNQAQPSDGSGSPDGDGTTASGGADCKTPPVVSGDAALNMVATQAWATRCAVRAGNAVKTTGDISDCSQPFTVEGDTAGMTEGENRASVEKLKALRKSICPMEGETGSDGPPGDGTGSDGVWDEGASNGLLGKLDDSGFIGGGSCPPPLSLDLGTWGAFSMDFPWWCDVIAKLGALVMFGCGIAALRILFEG